MLDQLIQEGKSLESEIEDNMLFGANYAKWIAKSSIILEREYPNYSATKQFVEVGKIAVGNFESKYYELIGILEGFKEALEIK